jgi:teichoic acid transport system permease protein
MSTTRVEAAPAAPTAGLLDGIPPEDLRRLRPVGARPPLGRYIADVWAHRSFIWALAVSGLRANNGRDRLGNFWLVLSPVMNGVIYFLVFGVMLATGKGVPNFVGYLIIGVFMFTYSNRTIAQGAKAITGNRKLIQTLAFPRAVLPIAEVVEQLLAFAVSFGAMMLLVLLVPPWEGISWRWLLLIPAIALQTVFNGGLVMIFARLTSRLSDVNNILPFLLRGWLYLSGVFYAASRFDHHPTLKMIFELNPAHAFLTIARDLVLYHQVPDLKVWLVAIGWTVPVAVLGFIVFWRAEEKYARD